MSHTRVKATFECEGPYASTEYVDIYCHHNLSCDITSFYYSDGRLVDCCFQEWGDRDKQHVMDDLLFPFKDKWGGELKDGVEFYAKGPWEE